MDGWRFNASGAQLHRVSRQIAETDFAGDVNPLWRVIRRSWVRFERSLNARTAAGKKFGIEHEHPRGRFQFGLVTPGNDEQLGPGRVRRIGNGHFRPLRTGPILEERRAMVLGHERNEVVFSRFFIKVNRKFGAAPVGKHADPGSRHACSFNFIARRCIGQHNRQIDALVVGKIDKRCRKLSELIGNAQFLTSQRERTRSVNGQPQRAMDGIFADIGIGTDEFELQLIEIFELFGVKFNVCGDALTEVFRMYGQSSFKFPVQTQIELRTHGNQRRRRSPIEMQLSADDDFISPHRKLNHCLLTQSGERERIAWNTNREIRQTAEGCIGRNDRLSGLIGAVDHACERLHLRRFFMLGSL